MVQNYTTTSTLSCSSFSKDLDVALTRLPFV